MSAEVEGLRALSAEVDGLRLLLVERLGTPHDLSLPELAGLLLNRLGIPPVTRRGAP